MLSNSTWLDKIMSSSRRKAKARDNAGRGTGRDGNSRANRGNDDKSTGGSQMCKQRSRGDLDLNEGTISEKDNPINFKFVGTLIIRRSKYHSKYTGSWVQRF